jgi:hypothetical protein
VQLTLAFLDDPDPSCHPWRALDPQARATAIEILARLSAAAVLAEIRGEVDDD